MAQRERKTKRLIEAEENFIRAANSPNWTRIAGVIALHAEDGDVDFLVIKGLVEAQAEYHEAKWEHTALQAARQSEKNDDA